MMNVADITSMLAPAVWPAAPTGVDVAAGASDDFASRVSGALETLDSAHALSDDLAVRAAAGEPVELVDYVVAATEAQLATQVTVAVRNKAVDAFNQIMAMNV